MTEIMNNIPYEDRVKVYKKAVAKYGADVQAMVAIEEMSELTKELCKARRGRDNREELAEEIADVTITLEQLRMIYGVNDDVCRQMDLKIRRLERRIDGTEGFCEISEI